MKKIKQICVPISPIFSTPNDNTTLETEGLYGELFEILSTYNDWSYGILLTDGYHGWIKSSDIRNSLNTNFRISNSFTLVKKEPNDKSNTIINLSMGSLIKANKHNDKWFQVTLNSYDNNLCGYVPKSHIMKIGNVEKDWVNYTKFFLSCPYKWGGRSFLGLDCSGLLQLSLQISGINLKRNTKDQINSEVFKSIKKSQIKKGCVIFWPGHVGVMTTKEKIIHANATTNNTVIQNLIDVDRKIYSDTGKKFKCFKIVY